METTRSSTPRSRAARTSCSRHQPVADHVEPHVGVCVGERAEDSEGVVDLLVRHESCQDADPRRAVAAGQRGVRIEAVVREVDAFGGDT